MSAKFNEGDQVQLKSGGPPMTVVHVPGPEKGQYHHVKEQYYCEWFKGATRDAGNFFEHVLQTYVPPSK